MKTILKNRSSRLHLLQISRRNGLFEDFLKVLEESYRICLDEKIDEMMPDLGSCNEVLDGCRRQPGSVSDAEKVMGIISSIGLSRNSDSFGSLAYLYAWRGHTLWLMIRELRLRLMTGTPSFMPFCKVGRLEDARRTYGRMVFLRFEPSSHTYLGGGGEGGVRPRNKWNKTPEAKGNKALEEKFQDDGSSDSLQEFGWS